MASPAMAAAVSPRRPPVTTARDADADEEDEVDGGTDPSALPVTAGDRPTRAPTHADCGHRMPLYEHTVESGEHLGIIAGRYGVRTVELVALNAQLSDPNLIRPGDKIRVCPEIFPRLVQRIEHEVKPGETLGAIAQTYGLTLEALLEGQDGAISNPNHVRAGQRLVVWVDGGLVPDFLPPEPSAKSASSKKKAGGASRPRVSVALSSSEHLHVKRPSAAYGTSKTIGLLEGAVAKYQRSHPGAPKVVVGDISRKGGGHFRPHLSHQTGRDIDLGYVLRGAQAGGTRFRGVTEDNLDVARTWALLEALLDTRQVVYVFVDYRIQQRLYEHAKAQGVSQRELDRLFQYPHGRGRAHGIIRHWPSHRHHFHVRFRN
ncbi:LysM peptidoglycan-binding domain-containing protein [Paraliomyxa miuraensis]|uniref:LysM peptidoglycan-binding domain-containing protein n=1 Tax=Paraliomyxa miuraensis TaxID=376150 RepID=UPI0022563764|nr:LysM peptidoglycan-binding domain-containing protein [Paraliomyxa miuraensis]MCX4243208.1 penicillin-insensitive murein endopeptidase [Paraliomyxa miuraensis]